RTAAKAGATWERVRKGLVPESLGTLCALKHATMISVEQIKDHLPKYLSPEKQRELVDQLREFEKRSYYTQLYADEMLQGDAWTGVEILNFANGARDKVRGLLLSNSCDLDPKNRRDFPPRVVFAPMIRLEAYVQLLERASIAKDQIARKVDAIK